MTFLRICLSSCAGSCKLGQHQPLRGMNSGEVVREGLIARSVTHEDAAANIDVLAERLANVLRGLAALPAEAQE